MTFIGNSLNILISELWNIYYSENKNITYTDGVLLYLKH